jgi:hypothetical protein
MTMDLLKTLLGGAVAIGMATAVLLPGRQTVPVLNAAQKFVSGTLHTSITGAA